MDWKLDSEGVLGASSFAVSLVGVLATLLRYGVEWGLALLAANGAAIVAALVVPAARLLLASRHERRRSHEAFVLRHAVVPTTERLRGSTATDASYVEAHSPGRFSVGEPKPDVDLPRDQAWSWLTQHAPTVADAAKAFEDQKEAVVAAHRQAVEAVREAILAATGLEDGESEAPGSLRAGAAARAFLAHRAWDAQRDVLGDPVRVEEGRGVVTLYADSSRLAVVPAAEAARVLGALSATYRGATVQEAFARVQREAARCVEARTRLLQALERIESDGRLRGRCAGCPR